VLSVVLLLTLRGPIMRRLGKDPDGADDIDSLIGATVAVDRDLQPGETGKAELRGTSWSAYNSSAEPLAAGQSCRVERVDGLTLYVRGNS
jgi:membrane protein implicated in regulation of membrane protease activity